MSAAPEHPDPDTELLAACKAMDALSAEFTADPRDHSPGSPEEDARFADDLRIKQEMRCVLARIERAPCTTLDGARTLALTLVREWPDTLKDRDDGAINHGLQRALIVKLLGAAADPVPKSAARADAATRALSVLEIGHHLREAYARYARADASSWLLAELLGWRRLALSRQPVTLRDAAAQLAVLFDHVLELDTQPLEERPECADLQDDLNVTVRVVALGMATVVDDSLPKRLAKHAAGAED
jgi:hypothetical protein